jgi:hypothetical protein
MSTDLDFILERYKAKEALKERARHQRPSVRRYITRKVKTAY